jgi:hypothetical protein
MDPDPEPSSYGPSESSKEIVEISLVHKPKESEWRDQDQTGKKNTDY